MSGGWIGVISASFVGGVVGTEHDAVRVVAGVDDVDVDVVNAEVVDDVGGSCQYCCLHGSDSEDVPL